MMAFPRKNAVILSFHAVESIQKRQRLLSVFLRLLGRLQNRLKRNCISQPFQFLPNHYPESQIDALEAERSKADNTRRRAKTLEERQEAKDRKKELTQKIAPLRKKLRQARKILDESPHLYELLQEEHRLEQAAYQRFRERMK